MGEAAQTVEKEVWYFLLCLHSRNYEEGQATLHVLTTLPFIDVNDVREKWVKYGGDQQLRVGELLMRLGGRLFFGFG